MAVAHREQAVRTAKEVRSDLVSRIRDQFDLSTDSLLHLEAAVSHWLQSPGQQLPHLPPEMRDFCLEQLGSDVPSSRHQPVAKEESGQLALPGLWADVPYPPPEHPKFTFIDLFAGIGGFRIAFQGAGGKCLFSCEWDRYAQKTYEANFGEVPYGDIRSIDKDQIPEHDILCAGFPCQPFSLAGVSKKNSLGRKHGFEDETQGTLFFEIMQILELKQPKAFMLENVKNLLSHDRGNTFAVIMERLTKDYVVNFAIVDGAKWVPQHRERIFIVGLSKAVFPGVTAKQIKIPLSPPKGYRYPHLRQIIQPDVAGHTLGPGTWATLERHKAHHEAQGNGFGYGLIPFPPAKGTVTRTISARYHKDGAEVLIQQPNKRPRRLTVREALQLQGFGREFRMPVSNTQAYRQIGNSVVVPAIAECAKMVAGLLA